MASKTGSRGRVDVMAESMREKAARGRGRAEKRDMGGDGRKGRREEKEGLSGLSKTRCMLLLIQGG